MALEAPAFEAVLDALRPAAPSAALARALVAAHDRRFIDLLRDDPVQPDEQAIRVSLPAIALFAFGDASLVPQFQRAVQLGAPPAPPQFFAGALAALVTAELSGRPAQGAWARAQAATYIATGRNLEAIAVVDARLAPQPGETDAQWLLLPAWYANIVRSDKTFASAPGATADKSEVSPSSRERFVPLARAYVAAGGTHAVLVTEWLNVFECVPTSFLTAGARAACRRS